MSDVLLIVDQYQCDKQAKKTEPFRIAKELHHTANIFDPTPQCMAIVNEYNRDGFTAFSQVHYEITSMNGNRATEIQDFITRVQDDVNRQPPKHLLLVSDDPTWRFLLNAVTAHNETQVHLWVPGQQVPPQLNRPQYHPRLLSDIVPEMKIPKVNIQLDFENLYFGLKERGWQPDVQQFNQVVRQIADQLGETVKIVAYADWDALQQQDRRNWQRELTKLGMKTEYLINERGKNTADMEIADHVRDLVERGANAPDAIDIVMLGTNDRDFRTTVGKARERGKRVVLLAIRGGLSQHLLKIVDPADIRYIDEHLPLAATPKQPSGQPPRPTDPYATLLVKIAAWLSRQGRQGWLFAPVDQLVDAMKLGADGKSQLLQAAQIGLLERRVSNGPRGPSETLSLNQAAPLAKVASELVRWAPRQVIAGLKQRRWDYVDSHALWQDMQRNPIFQQIGVGQARRDAEGWLELLQEAEVLISERRHHWSEPDKMITAWKLPTPNATVPPLPKPADAKPPSDGAPRPNGETHPPKPEQGGWERVV